MARSTPMAAGQFSHSIHVVRSRSEHRIAEAQMQRNVTALRGNIDANDFLRAQLAAERAGGEADRAEASDEHRVIAADSNLLQSFVDSAKSAGHLRPIEIGELDWEEGSDPSLPRADTRPSRHRVAIHRRGDIPGWCRRSCTRAGNRCTPRSRRYDTQSPDRRS